MPDRFPEAFERFERVVNIDRFRSYYELALAFQSWAGQNWKGSAKQWEALDREAKNSGFYPTNSYQGIRRKRGYTDFYERPNQTRRGESGILRGRARSVYRDIKTGRFIKKP
jgi:hypothetical protein